MEKHCVSSNQANSPRGELNLRAVTGSFGIRCWGSESGILVQYIQDGGRLSQFPTWRWGKNDGARWETSSELPLWFPSLQNHSWGFFTRWHQERLQHGGAGLVSGCGVWCCRRMGWDSKAAARKGSGDGEAEGNPWLCPLVSAHDDKIF